MKGLILKDFYLLKQLKTTFGIMFILSVIILFANEKGDNLQFIIGYMTIIGAMSVVNTISYDETNNSNLFLMTLPISKKLYTIEKYCFGTIIGIMFWAVSLVITTICIIIKQVDIIWIEYLIISVSLLGLLFILLSIMIPIELKFGAEKGRIIIICTIMAVAFGGSLLVKFLDKNKINYVKYLNIIFNKNWIWFVIIAIIAVIFCISVMISIYIMEKKQL